MLPLARKTKTKITPERRVYKIQKNKWRTFEREKKSGVRSIRSYARRRDRLPSIFSAESQREHLVISYEPPQVAIVASVNF